MKDYLENDINLGDIVLFNEKGSKGYWSSFSEGIVVRFHNKSQVAICNSEYYETFLERYNSKIPDYQLCGKYSYNTISLTALGLRERKNVDESIQS